LVFDVSVIEPLKISHFHHLTACFWPVIYCAGSNAGKKPTELVCSMFRKSVDLSHCHQCRKSSFTVLTGNRNCFPWPRTVACVTKSVFGTGWHTTLVNLLLCSNHISYRHLPVLLRIITCVQMRQCLCRKRFV